MSFVVLVVLLWSGLFEIILVHIFLFSFFIFPCNPEESQGKKRKREKKKKKQKKREVPSGLIFSIYPPPPLLLSLILWILLVVFNSCASILPFSIPNQQCCVVSLPFHLPTFYNPPLLQPAGFFTFISISCGHLTLLI